MYEFRWSQRRANASPPDVDGYRALFRSSARFLDDLLSLFNSDIKSEERYEIYPQQFLPLDAAEPHQSLQVNFLDLTVFQSPTSTPRLVHRLYD